MCGSWLFRRLPPSPVAPTGGTPAARPRCTLSTIPTTRGVAVHCPTCQSEVLPGQKFCPECGTRIEAACSSCGAALSPSAKFCPECGTPAQALGRPAGTTATPPAAAAEVAVAARRPVSLLFPHLFLFTP